MIEATVEPLSDVATLEADWRALEVRSDISFFQSWTWMGCLAEQRFPDAVLATARQSQQIVGLALLNRRQATGFSRLWLGETGSPNEDALAIEYNGPVVDRTVATDATDAIFRALGARWPTILSGLPTATAEIARRAAVARPIKKQAAPTAAPDDQYLARRSANTRQQIRRSDREFGDLIFETATDRESALAWFEEMIPLHQATWTARRKPGCFANPFFAVFHRALIARGWDRGEIALHRIRTPERTIGILYNFRFRGRELTYQSGFAYDTKRPRLKPGMTCHRLAIEAAARAGLSCYDFLAGADRYKRSLADSQENLEWLEIGPAWSPPLIARRLRDRFSRVQEPR